MKKFCKNVFWFTFWSGLSFVGFKIFKKIKAVIALDKTLPLYLGNVTEEKPKIKVSFAFKKLTIELEFSKGTLEKNADLEATILEYIKDFYPDLGKCAVSLKIVEKEVIAETPEKKEEVKVEKPVKEAKENKDTKKEDLK